MSRDTSTDYRHPHRPLPVALFNRVGRRVERMGLRADLSLSSLERGARRKTGLSDFGDRGYRRPLGLLLDSIEREARLTPLGRVMARSNLIRILAGRLRIEQQLCEHPEIDQSLEPPIFIVGLQRTGTTLLHRLLATDPRLRHLASWEAVNPAPLSTRNGGADPRIRQARLAEHALAYLAPDFFAVHPVQATAPEEDCLLLDFTFFSTVFEATQWVPGFSSWLEQQPDHGPAYRYYRRILQLLSWQRGGRWVLKTPHHMEHMDTLLSVFPGARMIHTHRDPVQALASFCSMMAHGYGLFSDDVDPDAVGRHWSHKAHRMVQLAMATRDRLGPEAGRHLLDVAYLDLVADPLAQVRRIYDWVELELTPQVERGMRAFLGANPQHKHGRHRYHLEHFGLDRDEEERRFASYRQRFNIPCAG